MDMQTFTGLIRAILAFVGGWVAGNDYLPADEWTTLSGGILGLAVAIWTIAHHKSVNKAIDETAHQNMTPDIVKKKIIP
jgi:hypothetical protein